MKMRSRLVTCFFGPLSATTTTAFVVTPITALDIVTRGLSTTFPTSTSNESSGHPSIHKHHHCRCSRRICWSSSASIYDKDKDAAVVVFRNATIGDLDLLLKWDRAEHVLENAGDENYNDWNWQYELSREPTPSWRQQWIATLVDTQRDKKQDIGFVQIIDPLLEESHYWGTNVEPNVRALDIWIGETDCIGKGFGTQMMHQVLDFCFSDSTAATAVLVDPLFQNHRAHRFYQRCGFRPIGERFFGPDHCLVHRIDRIEWKRARRGKT